MVLDDVFQVKQRSSHVDKEECGPWSVSPIDRLAAAVADLVIFIPLAALAIAPFGRQAREARILAADAEWGAAVVMALGAAFLALLAYQTITIVLLGATPGKLALDIKVVPLADENRRVQPLQAFMRSLFWSFELILLGIPWLAVFSNEQRRPIHDRVSDTRVVTFSKKRRASSAAPSLAEMAVASGFQSAALAIFAVVIISHLSEYHSRQAELNAHIAFLEDEGRLCTEVRESLERSTHRSGESVKDRLEAALTLYISGAVEAECLASESEFALWRGQESSLAYLAKGLSLEGEERAHEYFEKSCGGGENSESCRAISLIRGDEEGREEESRFEKEAFDVIASLDKESPEYMRALAIRFLSERREDSQALKLMDEAYDVENMRSYAAQERAKALWRMGRKAEARAALMTAIYLLDSRSRVETAQWFCRHESLSSGCSDESLLACQPIREIVNANESWLMRSDVASAYIHAESCSGLKTGVAQANTLALLKDRVPLKSGKRFVEAIEDVQSGDREKAAMRLKELVHLAQKEEGAFLADANIMLLNLAKESDVTSFVQTSWERMSERGEGWLMVGRGLLKTLARLQDWDRALTLGLRLRQIDRFDPDSLQLTLLAARRSGKTQVEHLIANGWMDMKNEERAERLPSSLTTDPQEEGTSR